MVERVTDGGITDERGGKEVVASIGECAVVVVDCFHALQRVTLEHEDRVVERRSNVSFGGKEVPCLLLGSDVIRVEIDRETWVGKPSFLAGRRAGGNPGPFGEVVVVSSDGLCRNGPNVVEGASKLRIDGGYTFLDNVEYDDRLGRIL